MRKYGFDYLVDKTQLLMEMPRPTTIMKPVSDNFNSLYEKLIQDEINRGNDSIGTRQLIVWRFIMSTLNDFLIERGAGYVDSDGEPLTSKELSNIFGKGTSHKATKIAVLNMVKKYKDLANDSEVMEFLRDPANMEEFKSHAGFAGDDTTSHNRAAKIKELQDITGMGLEDNEKLKAKLKDKIIQMNRMMAGRKASHTKRGLEYSPKRELENPEITAAKDIIDSINSAIKEDELLGGEFSQTALNDLNYLRDMYQKTIDGGQGTTFNEFREFIEKLKTMKGMTPDRIDAFDAVLSEVEDLEADASDQPDPESLGLTSRKRDVEEFEGYDPDVIDKVLTTPKEKELFKKWLDNHVKWRKIKNAKLEVRLQKQMDNKGLDKFIGDRPEMDNDTTFMNPAIMQLINTLRKHEKELETTEDEAKIKRIETKISKIKKQIESIRKGLNNEDEESGVMDYMTEQINSDSYINNIGEFKDRGFKKVANYSRWVC